MPVQAASFVPITWSPDSQYEHSASGKIDAHFYRYVGNPISHDRPKDTFNSPWHQLNSSRKVIVGNLILCQGDFVLIRNDEGDDDLDCDVAQILHLYENLDPLIKEDPCRAIVQWYSR